MVTTNEVSLVVYGEDKCSEPLVLGTDIPKGKSPKIEVGGKEEYMVLA